MHSLCVGFIKFLYIIKLIVVSKYACILKFPWYLRTEQHESTWLSMSECMFRFIFWTQFLYYNKKKNTTNKKSHTAGLKNYNTAFLCYQCITYSCLELAYIKKYNPTPSYKLFGLPACSLCQREAHTLHLWHPGHQHSLLLQVLFFFFLSKHSS